MDFGLKGKTAVVTGSTAGIGFGIASALAAEGARVVVNGRTERGLRPLWSVSGSGPSQRISWALPVISATLPASKPSSSKFPRPTSWSTTWGFLR